MEKNAAYDLHLIYTALIDHRHLMGNEGLI